MASKFTAIAGLLFAAALTLSAMEMQTYTFGNYEVTVIQDTNNTFPISIFGEDTGTLNKLHSIDHRNSATGSTNIFLLKNGTEITLIDAGYGSKDSQLLPALDALKIQPAQIKRVYLTHLHPDHIGGLLSPSGFAAFPNAAIWLSNPEYVKYRVNSPKLPQNIARLYRAYTGKIRRFNDEQEVLPGVRAVLLPGHTAGHCGFMVEEKLLIAGDFIHAAAWQFPLPEISTKWDENKEEAAITRIKLLSQAASNGITIAGSHLPFPSLGTVKIGTAGRKFIFMPQR